MDYHQERFDDHSLMVFNKEKLVGLLPANISNSVVYSHQGLSYGGLIVSNDADFKIVFNCFKTILEWLKKNQIKILHLKKLPSIYTIIPNDEIDCLLFKVEAKLTRRDALSVINLSQKERLKISNNRKRGLRRAVSHNLVVKEETDFDAFWNEILIPNLQKTHKVLPVHTLEEIKLLHARFPNNIKQFNVYKENKIVGGTTIFESKNVAHAQYISANESRQKLGTLDMLFNELINNTFKEKLYFDFGISSENQGQQINEGLVSWKESFGARSISQDFYSITTKNVELLNDLML